MADIPSASNAPPGRKPRAHRMSTRIDFTPMVDLGFLLITFFMLTTSLAKPSLMALVMPDDSGPDKQDIQASKCLTLILGAHDQVYWYAGLDDRQPDSTDFSNAGIRQVILNSMQQVNRKWGLELHKDPKSGLEKQGSMLYVLIKPEPGSRYRNLVDALDEMAICGVRYYTIM